MTTNASGWEMNTLPPVSPRDIGMRAPIVAAAVMRIGRSQ
jgi:hypothetical protein